MVPRAPSSLVLKWLAAVLRHVGGVTASVFTAIPVSSGSSDYYDSSVTLADFQGRFSHSSHSRITAALRFRAISV